MRRPWLASGRVDRRRRYLKADRTQAGSPSGRKSAVITEEHRSPSVRWRLAARVRELHRSPGMSRPKWGWDASGRMSARRLPSPRGCSLGTDSYDLHASR